MSDIKIVGQIELNTGDAAKKIEDVKKGLNETGDAAKKAEKKQEGLNETLKETGKTAKTSVGSLASVTNIIKGFGIVSIAEKGLSMLTEGFMKNQKAADFMTTAMNFVNKVISDFVNFLSENVGKVVDWFKGIFENPKKAISDFATSIKENLMERIRSLIDSFGYLAEIIKNVFSGEFGKAGEAAKKFGKEVVDVFTGVNNSADKIAEAAVKVADYTKETWNAAEAQTQLQNSAKLAAAQLQGLVEKYDRQAELQRQIRDDETKSIDERIAANNKLGDVLKEQQKAMLALAGKKIAAAQADLNANAGNVDMQVALTNAINERAAVLAQIAGFESEQKVNAVALAKEKIELDKTIAASEAKLLIDRKKAAAELIKDEVAKLNQLQVIADEERNIELKRLQDNINATKKGTQARADAEIAYNEKKQELDIADAQRTQQVDAIKLERKKTAKLSFLQNELDFNNLKKTIADAEIEDAITKSNRLIEIANNEHTAKINLLTAQRDAEILAAKQMGLDTSSIKQKYQIQIQAADAAHLQTTRQLSQAIVDTKVAEVETVGNLAKGLSAVINQESAAGKVAAIALATIDTFVAAWRAFTNAQKNPISILGPAYPYISAAAAAAAGIANIKKIASVQVPGASGGVSTPNASIAASAPILPQQTSTSLDSNTIQNIGNAAAGGVNRAYVVSSDIARDREREAQLNRAARL